MTIITNPSHGQIRERLYQLLAEKEGKKYTDALIKGLPDVPQSNPHYEYWLNRKASLGKFTSYLQQEFPGASILDVGCGTGWMSHLLSREQHKVTAVDVNRAVLKQAEQVFGISDKLDWLYVDVLEDRVPGAPFDIALFADSIQYFADVREVVEKVAPLLSPSGEIHFLDMTSQPKASLPYAQDRSFAYFSKLGVSDMGYFYYHHDQETLEATGFRKMHPASWARKFLFFSSRSRSTTPEWWYWKKG